MQAVMKYQAPQLYRIFPFKTESAVCMDGSSASNRPSCAAGPEASGAGGCHAGAAASGSCQPGAAAGFSCNTGTGHA